VEGEGGCYGPELVGGGEGAIVEGAEARDPARGEGVREDHQLVLAVPGGDTGGGHEGGGAQRPIPRFRGERGVYSSKAEENKNNDKIERTPKLSQPFLEGKAQPAEEMSGATPVGTRQGLCVPRQKPMTLIPTVRHAGWLLPCLESYPKPPSAGI